MADTTTFEAAAYTAQGTARERVRLPEALFDGSVNMPVMHQAVKAFLANQRQGNAATKTRRWVTGGNQKPWKQKGTGRARQGSIRAPNWVGGGTVFGPIPRSYAQYVPRQVRALARKSAFNARARENAIVVVDVFDFDAPKTKSMQAFIEKVGGVDKKVLVLTNGAKPNVFLSGRNLPNVHVMPYSDVSTYHILWSDLVVIEQSAFNGDAGDGDSASEQASETPDGGRRTSGKAKSAKPAKREAKARTSAKAEKKSAKSDKAAAKKSAKKKGK